MIKRDISDDNKHVHFLLWPDWLSSSFEANPPKQVLPYVQYSGVPRSLGTLIYIAFFRIWVQAWYYLGCQYG